MPKRPFTRSQANTSSSNASPAHRGSIPRRSQIPVCTPSTPGTPGPHESTVCQLARQQAFPPATPCSASRLQQFRQQLFMPRRHSSSPPAGPSRRRQSQSPARNTGGSQSSRQSSPRRPQPPDLRETMTQLTQALTTLTRGQTQIVRALAPAAAQPPQEPCNNEPPTDPDFVWNRLHLSTAQTLPTPSEGRVQRLATALFAKLPSLQGRDMHECLFLLDVCSFFDLFDDDLRQIVFERLNTLYLATHYGWGTAIAASATPTASPAMVPPGFDPQAQARRQLPRAQPQQRQQQYQQNRQYNRQRQPQGRQQQQAQAQPRRREPAARGRGNRGRGQQQQQQQLQVDDYAYPPA